MQIVWRFVISRSVPDKSIIDMKILDILGISFQIHFEVVEVVSYKNLILLFLISYGLHIFKC